MLSVSLEKKRLQDHQALVQPSLRAEERFVEEPAVCPGCRLLREDSYAMRCPACGWVDADAHHVIIHLQSEVSRLKRELDDIPQKLYASAVRCNLLTPRSLADYLSQFEEMLGLANTQRGDGVRVCYPEANESEPVRAAPSCPTSMEVTSR